VKFKHEIGDAHCQNLESQTLNSLCAHDNACHTVVVMALMVVVVVVVRGVWCVVCVSGRGGEGDNCDDLIFTSANKH
jgi:hypothetical protein